MVLKPYGLFSNLLSLNSDMELINRLLLNVRYAFNARKPLLTLRLVWAVFRSYLCRRPPMRYMDFAIDFACNLRCKHCFAETLKDDSRRKMTIDEYVRVARQAMKLGCVNFSFQGGEPLVFRNLGEIIAACQPWCNVISVATNGTLLTDENLDRLRDYGVDILTVSLDSAIASEHDKFRGMDGTYAEVLRGISRAREKGFKITIGTVVTHQTLHSKGLSRLIEMTTSQKIITILILPVPAGNWDANLDILLDAADMAYINRLTARSRYLRTDFQANFGPVGCGAAKEILYLTPYGDVLPCPFFHITFGNVREDSVETIRRRMLALPRLRVYHDKCLVSEDREFIGKYLSRTFGAERTPIPAEDVFGQSE